jgi:dTDP-glucose pyrophosphorylase
MREVALVMPMAGRGSRFSTHGSHLPKPLLDLWGRPFFWWATESARRAFPVVEMIFVILREHVEEFAIDRNIREEYPDARFVVIPDVTRGAAESAMIGINALNHDGPLIVNDTDHAFTVVACSGFINRLGNDAAAGLLTFTSNDPAYSYVRLDDTGNVIGTAEKRVISTNAIAGAYVFADPSSYRRAYEGYVADCAYNELFISGLYDRLLRAGEQVLMAQLDDHISFGTPEELERHGPAPRQPWSNWP